MWHKHTFHARLAGMERRNQPLWRAAVLINMPQNPLWLAAGIRGGPRGPYSWFHVLGQPRPQGAEDALETTGEAAKTRRLPSRSQR